MYIYVYAYVYTHIYIYICIDHVTHTTCYTSTASEAVIVGVNLLNKKLKLF